MSGRWVAYWFPKGWEARVFGNEPVVKWEAPNRVMLASDLETRVFAPQTVPLLAPTPDRDGEEEEG